MVQLDNPVILKITLCKRPAFSHSIPTHVIQLNILKKLSKSTSYILSNSFFKTNRLLITISLFNHKLGNGRNQRQILNIPFITQVILTMFWSLNRPMCKVTTIYFCRGGGNFIHIAIYMCTLECYSVARRTRALIFCKHRARSVQFRDLQSPSTYCCVLQLGCQNG